nr:uncharacterized protein LOC106677328 [Halyomorpha halys]
MFFFPSPPPKESLLVKCLRLLITVFLQTSSFHVLNCFLQTQFRPILAFHKISLCYIIMFSLEILYYKIFNGCIFCFFNFDTNMENDAEEDKLLVTTISYQVFLISYHLRRVCAGVKGVFTIIRDVFTVLEMVKSVFRDRGAGAILFIMFFYNLPDALLSLVCIIRSDTADSYSPRARRSPKLEFLYSLMYTITNFLLSTFLLRAMGTKNCPPLFLTIGYIFKIFSTSLVLNFLVMVLRRRYIAAVISFYKQLFQRTIRLEINYHEYYED